MSVALAIGSAVAALGSTIYGAINSKKYNDKMKALVQEERDENKRWYESQMASDYTQRTDAQSVLTKQRELFEEANKQARATNVVAGGTDQAEALRKASANDAMAQTSSDIAAKAAQHKDNVEQSYRQTDSAINQQQAQAYGQQASDTAQATSQLTNASLNLMGTALAGKGSTGTVAAGGTGGNASSGSTSTDASASTSGGGEVKKSSN